MQEKGEEKVMIIKLGKKKSIKLIFNIFNIHKNTKIRQIYMTWYI